MYPVLRFQLSGLIFPPPSPSYVLDFYVGISYPTVRNEPSLFKEWI